MEPVKVAEPLLTVASTEPVLAVKVKLVSPVTVRSMLVLAETTAELASVLVIVTEPVVAVAFNESVEMEPVALMLVSAVKVTLSVAVTVPVTETLAVVDDRLTSVPDTEPESVKVPEEVTV